MGPKVWARATQGAKPDAMRPAVPASARLVLMKFLRSWLCMRLPPCGFVGLLIWSTRSDIVTGEARPFHPRARMASSVTEMIADLWKRVPNAMLVLFVNAVRVQHGRSEPAEGSENRQIARNRFSSLYRRLSWVGFAVMMSRGCASRSSYRPVGETLTGASQALITP